jgi:hypothetical protein
MFRTGGSRANQHDCSASNPPGSCPTLRLFLSRPGEVVLREDRHFETLERVLSFAAHRLLASSA